MKIKRYKKVSKNLNFYVNNFKFRQPYQVLVDGTFCLAALNNKINIEDNIPRYLQAELKFLTTQCVYLETEKLGKKVVGALLILKKFAVHKCGHEKKPISGADCMLSMVGNCNASHYFIATQDLNLQAQLRKVQAVPLLYLHQKAPVLERPSQASLQSAKDDGCFLNATEKALIEKMKMKHGIVDSEEKPRKKRKKGGPNPLSCKKKKKKPNALQSGNVAKNQEGKAETEKKRRKKIRISKHIKAELLKSLNKE